GAQRSRRSWPAREGGAMSSRATLSHAFVHAAWTAAPPRVRAAALTLTFLALVAVSLAPAAGLASGASPAANPAVSLTPLSHTFDQPTFVTNAGDGSNRLFVVERTGRIQVLVNGVVQSPAYLDVSSLVSTRGAEQGLLGLAFHPSFSSNGYFYVYYTASDGADTLARYHATPSANVADG